MSWWNPSIASKQDPIMTKLVYVVAVTAASLDFICLYKAIAVLTHLAEGNSFLNTDLKSFCKWTTLNVKQGTNDGHELY